MQHYFAYDCCYSEAYYYLSTFLWHERFLYYAGICSFGEYLYERISDRKVMV